MATTRSQRLGERYNSSLPSLAAGADMFSSNFTATLPAGSLRISVALATGSTLIVREMDSTGSNPFNHVLNDAVALTANNAYTFDLATIVNNQYNIRVGTTQGSAIPRLVVQEIDRS